MVQMLLYHESYYRENHEVNALSLLIFYCLRRRLVHVIIENKH